MLKKYVALLFGLVGLTLVLAACGTSKASESSGNEPVEIEYWHPNAETMGGQTVTELIEEFNASQDEIIVKGVYNSGMYQGLMQNLQSAVAAGNEPALVQIGWSYREYFSNNFYHVEPQEIIEKHFTEDENYLEEKFLSNVLDLAVNNDGVQVGLPYSLSVPVLYVNMDMLNEAGVNPDDLTSWEAIAEASEKIKEATGDYGLYIAEAADNWNVQSMIQSNGGEVIVDEKAAFNSPEGKEAYEFYQALIENGSALKIGSDQGTQAFVSGDVGMAHMTIAQRTNVTTNGDFEVTAIPSPPFTGSEVKVPAGGSQLAITAQDEEKQKAAWEFMKFLYEPESVAAWTFGTGYLPETTDAIENEDLANLIEEDDMMAAAYATLDKLVPWAPFPGNSGLEVEQMLIDMRDRILDGSDVSSELETTQDAINDLLEK